MAEINLKLRQAKIAAQRDLLNRPGVTGVDIGFKEVGGRPTDTLAIRVLVEKKRDVPPGDRIPETVQGFPTDVIQRKFELHALAVDIQRLVPAADTKEYPILTGGISIGPCRPVGNQVYSGTLGAIVKDNTTGKPMILSNFHVMCIDKSWSDGDAIAQPSRGDNGSCPSSIVAALKRGVVGDQVDCAVAELSARQTDWQIVGIGAISGTNTATIGQAVRKRGRTTELTYGTVDTVDLTVNLDYGNDIGEIQLTNQIGIKPDLTLSAQFGASGDSGSVLLNDAGEAVGLYIAGDNGDNNNEPYSVANPIAPVLAALNVSMQSQLGQPSQPGQPGQPNQPGQPTQPGQPGQPSQPRQPASPCQPGDQPFLLPYPPVPLLPPRPFLIPYPPLPPLPKIPLPDGHDDACHSYCGYSSPSHALKGAYTQGVAWNKGW